MKRHTLPIVTALTLALASPLVIADEKSDDNSQPPPAYGWGPGMMQGPGAGYGPGYHMGPGMMYGPGYGYGPGHHMGPGMMYGPEYGRGYGPGYQMGPGMMYGPCYGRGTDDENTPYPCNRWMWQERR